jgi:hypothetical protein
MKKTFTIERTGEVITADVESITDVPLSRIKEVIRDYSRQKTKLFSNSEKKRYIIKKVRK